MEFSLHIVLDKLKKIDRYGKGLPWEYLVPVKQEHTFEASVWTARSIESTIKGRVAEKTEVREKKQSRGSIKSNKKNRFSKLDPSNEKSGGNNEAKWCKIFRKKHFGKGTKEVTYFKFGKIGLYANDQKAEQESCFKCGKAGHFQTAQKRKESQG